MKSKLIATLLVVISTTVAIVIAEYCLKANGFLASVPIIDHPNEPVMQEFDSILGWKNKPGEYEYPAYSSEVEEQVQVRFDENTFRYTSPQVRQAGQSSGKILFVGGSFVQGHAISDHETMAWKVQERYPDYEVMNWGVPAYGTYQSLLAMEHNQEELDSVKVVFYGFLDHHLQRNVATPVWMDLLSAAKQRKHVDVPSVSLEDGKLIRQEPEAYTRIPFGSSLAFTKLIERNMVNYKSEISVEEQYEVLILLLNEMNQLVEQKGAKLVVIGFNLQAAYVKLLEEINFTVLDCQWNMGDPSYSVQGEGHPSGKTNTYWADKVEEYLEQGK